MTPEEVLATYDEGYARRYDDVFLLSPEHGFLAKTLFEVELLRRITSEADSWLDVACGTGYFLRCARGHAELDCGGLDLSPAMVEQATRRNPDAQIVLGSFLEPHRAFRNRWSVTSCMWGAYGLQERLADIETLVANLARWTAPGGTCFMPVFDLALFEERRASGRLLEGVELDMSSHRWSFVEPDGKVHRAMLAPPAPTMVDMFARHFGHAESFRYPMSPGQDDGLPMVGILAGKGVAPPKAVDVSAAGLALQAAPTG